MDNVKPEMPVINGTQIGRKQKAQDQNRVMLRGVITRIFTTPRKSTLMVSCKNYHTKKRDEKGRQPSNVIPVVFYGKEYHERISQLKQYDHVTVTAIIQEVYNQQLLESHQEYWGLEIEKTLTTLGELTGGLTKGTYYPDDYNAAILEGRIRSSYAFDNGWVSITVRTKVGDYLSYCRVSYPAKNKADGERLTNEVFTKGTRVLFVGALRSSEGKKKVRGRSLINYSFVADEYSVIGNVQKPQKPILEVTGKPDTSDLEKAEDGTAPEHWTRTPDISDLPIPQPCVPEVTDTDENSGKPDS